MRRYVPVIALLVSVCACRDDDPNATIEATRARAEPPRTEALRDEPAPAAAPKTTKTAPETEFRHQFVAAAKAISPAVVSITSTSTERVSPMGSPFDLFGGGAGPGSGGTRRGIGSGVIVDLTGHVLTNNHVVADADEVKVMLAGNQEIRAKLVGTDPKTDLAVVKIDPGKVKLTAAVLGDSDALEVGEWVIAAGSPFGLRQTVSAGIVSAIGRGNVGITEYEDFIQTDAAINPGNSGGPLVDLDGRVVGINTAIASQSGSNSGVGFAIPIGMAKAVLDQLVKTGKVVRGYAGLLIGDLNEDLAASFGFRRTGGALVQDVTPRGPAARAGAKPGDIVFERDGKAIANAAAFRNGIADTRPGTTVKLKLWREGKELELPVTLGELPGSSESAGVVGEADDRENARWGIALVDLTPELAQRLQTGTDEGALVQDVVSASPAEQAGLEAGDVIVEIDGKRIESAQKARERLTKSDGPIRLRVVRQGHGMYVMLPKR